MSGKSGPAAVLLCLLGVACAAGAAPTPAPPDAFLAQLAGRWELAGSVRGKPAHYRAEGRWELQHGWLRLAMIDTARPPAYQADLYLGFDPQAGDYIAHWLDQFGAAGARVVATGQRDGQTLVLLFPYPEGAFRDTLSLAPGGGRGTLLLESQQKDGSWSTFASYTLTRAREARHPHPLTPAPGRQ
jgi:hypothetical protein